MKAKRKARPARKTQRRSRPKQVAALVVREPEPKPWQVSQDELTILKNAVCKGASDEELKYCLAVASRYKLDPFKGQIWFTPRWDSQAERSDGEKGGKVYVPVVGINGLLHIAARDHADFGTYSEPEFGPMIEVEWIDKYDGNRKKKFKAPEWARIEARKKGCAEPTVARVYWEEIYPDVSRAPMVRRMPRLMLGKCAKANATRTSYPETGGLLIPEETHTREFEEFTPGGRLVTAVPTNTVRETQQQIAERVIAEKKKAMAERAPSSPSGKGAEVGTVNGGRETVSRTVDTPPASAPKATEAVTSPAASVKPLMEVEYIDPDKSRCKECGCSFGVHLVTCSKFVDPQKPKTPPPPKTEAAFEAKRAAAVQGKACKVYRHKLGETTVLMFHKEPVEPLAYLMDHGLKDFVTWEPNAKAYYLTDDEAILATFSKAAADMGITIEEVAGPGPMAPPAAKTPAQPKGTPPTTVKAAPEPPPTAGVATIQSAKEKVSENGKIRLLVMFGGVPHSVWARHLWPPIQGSIGQSAEFVVETKGQWKTIKGIKRIGNREYIDDAPVRTMDDMGQASFF